jgi:hypothetical protein
MGIPTQHTNHRAPHRSDSLLGETSFSVCPFEAADLVTKFEGTRAGTGEGGCCTCSYFWTFCCWTGWYGETVFKKYFPFILVNVGRGLRLGQDSSVTVEPVVPAVGEPGAGAPIPRVKQEGQAVPNPTTPRKSTTTTKTKVKKELDDGIDEFDDDEEMELEDRIDLAEMNFPGGPISSRRTSTRNGRGWKKVELWIEQEETDEIIIDDEPTASQPPQPIQVKVEDEPMGGIIVPMPGPMVIEDPETTAEKLRLAEKSRARQRRRRVKGKSREEKEELAREELDLEVLRDQFSGDDGTEVVIFIVILISEGAETVFAAVADDITASA